MKHLILVCAVTLAPLNGASAQPFMETGNDFVNECPLDGRLYRTCMAYIKAAGESLKVQDASGKMHLCVPAKNTAQQLYDIVAKELHDHPERRSQWLYPLVSNSLLRAFPCR